MMVPNEVVQRINRVLYTLQQEKQTEEIQLARKGLESAKYWVDSEKQRRIREKVADQERRLKEQKESNPS